MNNVDKLLTVAMIKAWAVNFQIEPEDFTQWPGIVGSLTKLAEGEGELTKETAPLFENEETAEIMAPLKEAYLAAIAAKSQA